MLNCVFLADYHFPAHSFPSTTALSRIGLQAVSFYNIIAQRSNGQQRPQLWKALIRALVVKFFPASPKIPSEADTQSFLNRKSVLITNQIMPSEQLRDTPTPTISGFVKPTQAQAASEKLSAV
jgi:hypothetical protein